MTGWLIFIVAIYNGYISTWEAGILGIDITKITGSSITLIR
jgi:hypothetical protein